MTQPTDGTSQPERPLPPELDPRGRRPSQGVPRIARTPQGPPPQRPVRGDPQPVLPTARPPGRPRRVAARALSFAAAATSVAVLTTSGVGYALYRNYDGNISRFGDLSLPGQDRPDAAPRDARNVLLVGSDSREDTGGEFQGEGAEEVAGLRPDTIILAHLYGDSDAAQLVSFPRDSFVTIPAYTDPLTEEERPERQGKINSAIAEGGMPLLVLTLEELTSIRVDNAVVIDFAGLQAMVDELGGVQVCLIEDVREPESGIDLQAGTQTVRGDLALAFVRQRHGLRNGDIDRIGRQQHFIASMFREVLSRRTLSNPGRLSGFLTENVDVDNGLASDELFDLALRLRGFTSGGVLFTTVPISDITRRVAGIGLVVDLDEAATEELFAELRADRPPPAISDVAQAPGSPSAEPVPDLFVRPGVVRVAVFNGAGVQGLGRTAAEDLASKGFQVVGDPTDRGSGATATEVRHCPDKADSARTVAASIPGAQLVLDEDLGSTVEVVVGAGYTGVFDVEIGLPPTGATPEAAEAPQTRPLKGASTSALRTRAQRPGPGALHFEAERAPRGDLRV